MEAKKYLIHCRTPAQGPFQAERLIEITTAYVKAEGMWATENTDQKIVALIPWSNVLVAEVDDA